MPLYLLWLLPAVALIAACERSPSHLVANLDPPASSSASEEGTADGDEGVAEPGEGSEGDTEGEGEATILWTNSGSACVEKKGYPTLDACQADAADLTKEAADGELGTQCIQVDKGRAVAGPIMSYLLPDHCCAKQTVTCFAK
jgi:hypothetical protein